MKLKYGNREIEYSLAENKIIDIIKAREKEGIEDPLTKIKDSIRHPTGTPPLERLIKEKNPEKIAIIVNDITRPTPYNFILPPLLNTLHKTGIKKEQITFYIATGIHAPHTQEQNINFYGKELIDNYHFVSHDADGELVYKGKLSSGNKFYVNKEINDTDFIILTGVILPHYFAGFSGGRKSILPGVAGRETIENNHSRMVNLMGHLPDIKENPLSLEMIEAARKMKVDFILNVVTNSKREIVRVVAGDLEEAWYAGIDESANMYHVPIDEKADLTIVSPGGYPRDINIYQSQKALDHADHATKKGGTIILLAECKEGMGEKTFEQWMKEAKIPEDNVKRIKEKFMLGGHKAYAISKVARDKEIIIVSSLDKATTEMLFAKKITSLAEAMEYVNKKYNDDYKVIIMPQGSLTVPVIR